MKRWALNLIACFSGALSIVATIIWLESDRSHPVVRWNFIPREPAAAAPSTSYALRWTDDRILVSRLIYNFDHRVDFDLLQILLQIEQANITRQLTCPGLSWTFGTPSQSYPESPVGRTRSSSFAGVRWESTDGPAIAAGLSTRCISVPAWVLPLLLALPLLARITPAGYRAARVRYRLRRGLCPRCRYDLRATPDRCPECGCATMPAMQAAARFAVAAASPRR